MRVMLPRCGAFQGENKIPSDRCSFPRPMPPLGFRWTCPWCGKHYVVKAITEHHWQPESRGADRDVPEAVLGGDYEPDATGHPR